MQWFDQNPHGENAGVIKNNMWEQHTTNRARFANSYAKGGFAATAFAPTRGEMMKAPWRKKSRQGSSQHLQNLKKLQQGNPGHEGIAKSITKAEQGIAKAGVLGKVAGVAFNGVFAVLPAFTTPGGVNEKARAVGAGITGLGGFAVGAKLGMGVGASIGAFIPLPGMTALGGAIGGLVGGFGAMIGVEEAFHAVLGIPDRMVERERAKGRLNWINDSSAFQTQKAHTMRQQSLQSMNRGMTTSRSLLGREGVHLHQ